MEKIAFVFAGQGAQYPGMGRSLCEVSEAAAEVFRLADSIRPGTSQQCVTGTKEELCITSNTQPCLYAVDLAAAEALRECGIVPEAAAGFSLGEAAALTFSGAFSPEDGFRLVCRRGELMGEAAEKTPGSMAAVLKLGNETVEELCARFERMYPVNYNCAGQLVVAGAKEEMPAFCEAVAETGGKARVLAVGGGFHSPFMEEASRRFAEALEETEMKKPQIPVYANRTAAPYGENGRSLFAEQMRCPVLWQQTVEQMAKDGVTAFIEVGPGKTLSGLIRRILPDAAVYQVQDAEGLQAVKEAFQK